MTSLIPPAKPIIGDDERAAVDRVMRSGMIAQGPEVAAFEQEFADHLVGGRTCVAVNSGTAGPAPRPARRGRRPRRRGDRPVLHVRGDRQLGGARRARRRSSPTSTRSPSASTPTAVEASDHRAHDGDHARAPVRPPGRHGRSRRGRRAPRAAAVRGRRAGARRHRWTARPVGSFGDFAMFSLYPTKNMTSGEGGMVSLRRPTRSPAPCGCCATRAWRSSTRTRSSGSTPG